jgi:tRNA nucleotidyltransferase (CCA-adding enzyme)
MITKNIKMFDIEKFIKNLKRTLEEKGYKILSSQEMTEKSFPRITVLTVLKKNNLFKISLVLDKNGITVTAVGIKEDKLKKEISGILEHLL